MLTHHDKESISSIETNSEAIRGETATALCKYKGVHQNSKHGKLEHTYISLYLK